MAAEMSWDVKLEKKTGGTTTPALKQKVGRDGDDLVVPAEHSSDDGQ